MAPSLAERQCSPPWTADAAPRKNILYIDAYDSFSYNVVGMLEETLPVSVTVLLIDSSWPGGDMVQFLRHYEAVVLGPGPGNPTIPSDVGLMNDIWALPRCHWLPVFGICLGFQSLCLHGGAGIRRLPYPLHGQVRRVATAGTDVFAGLQDVQVTLYHSLCADFARGQADTPASKLDLLAWLSVDDSECVASDQALVPMAARHKTKPFWGVQFHPESCKSDREACTRLLRRWWGMALDFNEKAGRAPYPGVPSGAAGLSGAVDSDSLPDVAFTMLKWSAATSEHAHYRSLSSTSLSAERICETLNEPRSPTVLFHDSGRHSIVSVPSPGSWRLEYYAQPGKLLLRKAPAQRSAWDAAEYNEGETVVDSSLSVSRFWDVMRHLMERKRVYSGSRAVPFWGGFLGYFSYEMGLACLAHPKTTLGTGSQHSDQGDPPDVSLLWTDRSVIVDKTGQITIQSIRESDDSQSGWLDQTLQQLNGLSDEHTPVENGDNDAGAEFLDSILREGEIKFPNEQSYKKQVDACKTELEAGESYELCLTCETSIALPRAHTPHQRASFPWELYKRLKKYNPARFSAYARLGDVKIASSSPECFLTWDRQSTLSMKPMKGTVRKSDDMTMEKAKEILGSTKEMAENLMIADLIRHDLYGICGSGGVRVEKLLEVEDHGRVFQMVTHVQGEVDYRQRGTAVRGLPQLKTLNMAVYGVTALQKCLPPGSMTGAPKERSCVHLRTIEARKRGIYSGVMGYLDLGGGGSFSVLIRTAFSSSSEDERQLWRIGAGGAVTTLSTAEGEWDEMLTKLRTVCNVFRPMS
ncbi:Para-aminobenzoate synthase [Aspergillus sp. HF37]|nr:Para-aminobenzoate synthase [Aspergillus sp. HF37]